MLEETRQRRLINSAKARYEKPKKAKKGTLAQLAAAYYKRNPSSPMEPAEAFPTPTEPEAVQVGTKKQQQPKRRQLNGQRQRKRHKELHTPKQIEAASKMRNCLKCNNQFYSEGIGNRICEYCNTENTNLSPSNQAVKLLPAFSRRRGGMDQG